MTKRTHKNLASLLLVLSFFVAEFNFFVVQASAAIYPSITPSQISIDLSDWLLNGAAYSIDVPPADLASVMAIPSDLYEPAHQWQADKITANIEKDPVVANRVKEAFDAKFACEGDLDCASGLLITAEGKKLKEAINNKMDALVASLASARAVQDSTIDAYQAQNGAAEAINDKYSTYSEIASSSDAGISAINQIDIGSASQAPEITQEQITASRLAQQNASAWNTDDAIALKMQQDCNVIKGRLMPCFAEAVYKIIYRPTAYALMGTGYIFDQILTLSIEGAMVAPPFIDSTWKVVRDFSNMIFIFILLYAGVETILGGKNWMKTIRLVIIIALLINFSLFFTKVVIDAGNVLAVGVKSAISTTSVSEGLAAAFQPQKFLSAATKGPDTSGGDAIIVFLVAAVVSGFAAYIFFKAALLFMGRLIAFWGLMIISPFAFVSMAMPKGNIFSKWLDTLISQAFVAPVFLFFVYIIMKVISGGTGILSGLPQTDDWFKDLLGPVIVATLLIIALKQALGIATDMSGKMGKLGSDMAGTALGLAAGVATGGVALAGRGLIGGYAAKKLAGGTLEEGSWQHNLATGATRASFDVRSLAGEKSILGKKVGGMISKGGGAFGVDVGKATIGGVEKAEKTRIEKELDKAKKSEMSVFETQGAHAREAKQKEVVRVAEEARGVAQKTHESSETGRLVAEKTTAVESSKIAVEEAEKKTEEAEKAHVAMSNSGMNDPRIIKALEDAKKAEQAALDNLYREESSLIAAESDHAASSTATALKTATDAVEEAKAKVVSAKETIEATNNARRESNAVKADKAGRHTTAAKIRKGEESGQEKSAKRLAAEKKKEEERDGGARPDVIASIDERIEENKNKE